MSPQKLTWLAILVVTLFVVQTLTFSEDSDSRSAIPTPDKQKAIRAQLDESLGLAKARTKADKERAVTKLMELVDQSDNSPDDLYVSLITVIPLVRETGDFAAHQIAVQKLVETFSTEPIKEQTQLLLLFLSSCKSKESLEPAVEELVALATSEGQANQFTEPLEWLATVDKVARKLKSNTSVALIASTKLSLTLRQNAFSAHEKAQQSLATNPGDTQANLDEGLWLAVFNDDWSTALPLLAKSSDPQWKAAATAELAAGEAVDSQLKVADAWWEVAQAAGPYQRLVRHRALSWYTKAESNVTSPITKTRVTKRKEELFATLTSEVAGTPVPATKASGKGAKKPLDENELPEGESIDILALVKLPDHAVLGNWTRQDGAIFGQAFPQQRFMVPVVVAGNYQLTCKFTRRTGTGDASLMLPVGDRGCLIVCMDNVFGLHLVNGKPVWDLTATPAAVRRNGLLTNGVTYTLQVMVRQEGQKVAIQSSLNGQQLISWSGQSSNCSMRACIRFLICMRLVFIRLTPSSTCMS